MFAVRQGRRQEERRRERGKKKRGGGGEGKKEGVGGVLTGRALTNRYLHRHRKCFLSST